MITGIVIFAHVILSVLVIVLVLMHSGQNSGLGSIGGGTGQGGGGQHVLERNLDRVTIFVSVLYVCTTLVLAKLYS